MSIKILHTADLHMDSPFETLGADLAAARRGEQREMLGRVADLVNSGGVELVLCSGDLLDSASSYYETAQALIAAFSDMRAEVFIAPGNHDYYCAKSPYSYLDFSPNVHIFKSSQMESVELPRLGCRVYGAAFTSTSSRPLLTGFRAEDDGFINIMAMHGDIAGDIYNKITPQEIAASGLDYLALGHIHAFSGIKKSGGTTYAYPGCPLGRGFDETGRRGVITGEVSKGGADLRFTPLGGREYRIVEIDLTGKSDVISAICDGTTQEDKQSICRVLLRGEYEGGFDCDAVVSALIRVFYHVSVKNETRPRRDLWKGAGEDTLRGLFLSEMRSQYDAAGEDMKEQITLAVRYGLAALDNGEEWRS